MAGGDVPSDAFERMIWTSTEKTISAETTQPELTNCDLKNMCLEIDPGDLKTVVITGHFIPPKYTL
jgi:hypothetical protein